MPDSSIFDALAEIEERLGEPEGDESALRAMLEVLESTQLKAPDTSRVAAAASAIAAKTRSMDTRARACLLQARAARLSANFWRARECANEAISMFTRLDDRHREGNCHLLLGAVESETGNLERSSSAYRRAEEAFLVTGDMRGMAATAYNRGLIHIHRSELHEAKGSFERAESQFRSIGEALSAAICRMSLGNALDLCGRHEEALEAYMEARSQFDALDDRDRAARCLLNAGNAFSGAGRAKRASAMFREASAVFAELGNRRLEAACYLNDAEAQYKSGERESPWQLLVAALRIFRRLQDPLGIAECRLGLARLRDSPKLAERALKSTDRLGDRLRGAEAARLVAKYQAGEARERTLVGALDRVEAALASNPDLTLRFGARKRFSGIAAELAECRVLSGDLPGAWQAMLRGQFCTQTGETCSEISASQAAVQLIAHQGRVRLIAATEGHFHTILTEADCDQVVRTGCEALQILSQPGQKANHLLRSLYDWLILPLHELLAPCSRASFICSPELESIPFGALISPEGKHLIEDLEIVLSRGLTPRGPRDSRSLFVATRSQFAPPLPCLPGAEAEAKSIISLFPGTATNRDCSVGEVKLGLADNSFAHLATHAISNRANPAASALVFAPDGDCPTGYLYAREISEMSLSNELVVLSACETGEQGVSLAQALLQAGARQVLASSWRAHDEASLLWMNAFYGELKTGDAPAAHRAAVRSLLRGRFADPHYWALWKLLG